MTTDSRTPTDEDRRRAICSVMGRAPVLIRYARRYVSCVDDAEDAYQRAMEIALTKAPATEPGRLVAWLYTVVRNEALAVAEERSRQRLGRAEDVAVTADGSATGASLERDAEWRERYRGIQDALGSLSQQQRTCVMLQSAGLSYDQIAEATGFSHRQIERSISRGRSRLHAWEDKLETGAACSELRPVLERVVARVASDAEVRRVGRHVRACAGCRLALRQRLTTAQTLAGLVPVAVIADVGSGASAPDPGVVIAYWERVTGAGAARVGQLITTLLEAPSTGLARAGGAAAALAIAGLAVLPVIGDAFPSDPGEPRTQLPEQVVEATSPWSAGVLVAAAQTSIAVAAVPTPQAPQKAKAVTRRHRTTRPAARAARNPASSSIPRTPQPKSVATARVAAVPAGTPGGEFGP